MAGRRLFCFGLGYTARVFAARLKTAGWRIAGTTRDADEAAVLRRQGIEAFIFDRDRPLEDAMGALRGTTHILSSVPPDSAGDAVIDCHGIDLAACGGLEWVGYFSTTGVYGDRAGAWVEEDSAQEPTGERGRRRVAAERAWLSLHAQGGVPVHLFRLAGIYGPGRNALAAVRSGKARRLDKPGQVFSRIHVEDIASVLQASLGHPNPGRAYNVCDDDPAPPAEVIAHACDLLGVEPPPLVPFEAADLSPMARGFYRDNKRVSNRRIKQELGVSLAYPDYKAGLKALLGHLAAQGRDRPG